jgi:hypothetical protein
MINIGQLKELQQIINKIKVKIDEESEKEKLYAKYTKLYVTHPTFTIFRQIFLKELKISNIGSESELDMKKFNLIFKSTTEKSNAYIENLIIKINGLLKAMKNTNINQNNELNLWEKYVSQLENSMKAWNNNNLGNFMVALWAKQYTKNITEDLQNLINSNIKLLLPSK